MEFIDRADSVRVSWQMAIDKGYVQQAIVEYTVPEFTQFISALLPGVLMAMAVPIIGQMGGGIAGAVIGSFIGPEGTWAGAEVGQTLGLAAANLLLLKWGLDFIKDFILPQVGTVGTQLGDGLRDAWNAGGWGPSAKLCLQDAAARKIANGIGFLFGLLLMGIVLWLMKEPSKRIGKFQDSMLAKASPRLTMWLETNLSSLQQRYRGGLNLNPEAVRPPAAVTTGTTALERARIRWGPQAAALGLAEYEPQLIEGELPPGTAMDLEMARQAAMRVIPALVDRGGNMIPTSLQQMDAILTNAGYTLIRADDFGPNEGNTGFQLFYRMGKVLVRFKTTGENRGPRQGRPHVSVGYFDGEGMDFRNDKAKFTIDGTVVAKTQGALRVDRNAPPVQWTLLTADFSGPMMDAWAARCHFNAVQNFDLGVLEAVVRRVRPGFHRPPPIVPISTQRPKK